jgi:phosphoribosylglycinamide formyltransferase 1
MTPRIVICASGEGTNFEAIVRAFQLKELRAEVIGLVVSRDNIGAIGRAKRLGIPHRILNPREQAARSEWDQAMVHQLEAWSADWIVLAGFLALVGPKVLSRYPQRIVNSHPSLLPKYGGAGMYGDRVHAAVLAAGDSETGITIHTIDGEYDRGQILAQDKILVHPGDTVDTLATRVKAREVLFYPKVLNDLVTGRITVG